MSVTRAINNFQVSFGASNRAFTEIYYDVQKDLHTFVQARFSRDLNALTEVTDLVDQTLIETRRLLGSGSPEYVGFTRDRLLGLVVRIALGKLNDERKKENAAKRSKGCTSELNDETTPSIDASPDEKTSKSEMFTTLLALLLEGEKPIDQVINILGIALELSSRQIEEVFVKAYKKPPISHSSIIRKLRSTKTRLRKRFPESEWDCRDA